MKTLLLLLSLMLVPTAWADKPDSRYALKHRASADAPGGGLMLEHYEVKIHPYELGSRVKDDDHETSLYQEWLAEEGEPENRALLIQHSHNVGLEFSPDASLLIVNNHTGSNESIIQLFKRVTKVRYEEVKEPNLDDLLWGFFDEINSTKANGAVISSDNETSFYDHHYVKCNQWAADGSAILVGFSGHLNRDNHIEGFWHCVLDIKTMKPSLDLSIMNRGKPVIKRDLKSGEPDYSQSSDPYIANYHAHLARKNHIEDDFLCVFDPQTQQPSFDLNVINRNQVMMGGKLRGAEDQSWRK